MPSFILSADLQLRPCTWAGRQSIAGDSYAALTAIVDLCLLERKPLLLAGDIFNDRRPPFDTVRVFAEQMRRLHDASIPCWVICGNHDPDPWPLLSAGVELADRRVILLPTDNPDRMVRAYGLSFRHPDELQALLADIPPDCPVLISHQLLDMAAPMPGAFNMKAEWVPDQVKTVLMGDVHETRVMPDPRGTMFVYPGSTFLHTWGEGAAR